MTAQDEQPLVSVVVPAYNAEATLAETLASATAQHYGHLEIIVVDDGSTDGTAKVAAGFAARDARVRLLSPGKCGVAAARNAGVAASAGIYVAPLDADDLWHPGYLAKMVARLRGAPPGTAFVHAACRLIDARSDVVGFGLNTGIEGWAGQRMAYCNFVGNGSAIVMTRAAFDAAGGYEPRLQAAGCPGSEDHLLQMRLAALGPIVAVPQYLIGYRQGPAAMSRDMRRMTASDRLARRLFESALPPRLARWTTAHRCLLAASGEAAAGRPARAAASFARAFAADPVAAVAAVAARLQSFVRRGITPAAKSLPFRDADPSRADAAPDVRARDIGPFRRLQMARLKKLAALEDRF